MIFFGSAVTPAGRADPSVLSSARVWYADAVKSYTLDEDLKLISPKILTLLEAK